MQERYLTVTSLNRYLKAKLDSDHHLNHIYVQGELSNVKYHYSGHCYFTLKDEKSRISAVMFASALKKVPFRLEDGMRVVLAARVSIYEAGGTYQLYVEKLDIDGLGNLYLAFEALKKKLEQQGLFSSEHKKEIPLYCEKIGVITAQDGAAIHDICQTIYARCPSAQIYFYPSLVQGEHAAKQLIARLQQADRDELDVLIIGRGGGSLEDLFAFNDERLAYAIYQAKTPIISGVGHESDVTICDFVADYRAATPTAAATKAAFSQADLILKLASFQKQMLRLFERNISAKKRELISLEQSNVLLHPECLYENAYVKLDEYMEQMHQSMVTKMISLHERNQRNHLMLCHTIEHLLKHSQQQLNYQQALFSKVFTYRLSMENKRFQSTVSQLNALSPLHILDRGYTLTLQDQHIVTEKKQVDHQKPMILRFKDGELIVKVEEEQYEKNEL